MARRPLGYLHQNRHGSFTFRWRPTLDVAGQFAQPAFEFSLATKSREQAWRRALPATMRVNRLVSTLRAMSHSKQPKQPLLTTELVRFLVMPDGKEHKVDYDAGDPAEIAQANRIFDELAKGVAEGLGDLQRFDATPTPSTSSAGRAALRDGLTISGAFAAFCAEKNQSDAWKDPEHAERYDFGPIITELIGVAGDRPIARLSVEPADL